MSMGTSELPTGYGAARTGGVLDANSVLRTMGAALINDRRRGRRTGLVTVQILAEPLEDLVRELALRLDSDARDADAVGRVAPDRLALVVPGLKEVDALAAIVVRVRNTLSRPVIVLGTEHECPIEVNGVLADARSTPEGLLHTVV
ncbi:MAG: hypothetical protein R2705_14125 [Ilumatobacteraceae bacterium]